MQCLFVYPQVGYSQFELMMAVEQLQLHCGPLLKEVLVARQVLEVSGKLWFPLGRRRGHLRAASILPCQDVLQKRFHQGPLWS